VFSGDDDIYQSLSRAFVFVQDMPSPEERLKTDAVLAIRNAVVACEKAEINSEGVAMMLNLADSLAENAIEHKKGV